MELQSLLHYGLLLCAGLVAGTVNVVAGGGSFLTLPILIFMGLPVLEANGTNRVGILLQNVGAVAGFHHYRVLDWKSLIWAALPAAFGALLGVWIAFQISAESFQNILAFLMVAITLWNLWSPLSRKNPSAPAIRTATQSLLLAVGFFVVGIYGGFVQAGVGFLILGVTTAAGLDLVRGNAVKVLSILVFTGISLALFAWQGQVNWIYGLVLAAGTVVGGQLGVRLAVRKGHRWIRAVVTVTIIIFAIKLWLLG
ncbi:MAG: sulfite exporter TauE/SafE family protein [Acidobacteriota bacterium]